MDAVAKRKELIAGPAALRYGELFDRVPRIGALLESLNIAAGDRVIILSDHDSAVATLFFGVIAQVIGDISRLYLYRRGF